MSKAKEKVKAAAILAIKEAEKAQDVFYFHDRSRKPWATVPVGSHHESWLIYSHEMWLWIARVLRAKNIPVTPKLVKEIQDEMMVNAHLDGPEIDVHVRVGESKGAMYVDVGDPEWRAIKITAAGWEIVTEYEVKFHRPMGVAALPLPAKGGHIRDILRFLNVRKEQEILFFSWLTYSYRQDVSYLILCMSGVQGSGKSTSTKVLRALVDPSIAQLSGVPKDELSVIMAAANSRLLTFDNMSLITPSMADLLCRIATGGSRRDRKYFTNDGSEVMFIYRNPIVLNGIAELVDRPDLLDRSLVVNLQAISEKDRMVESVFNAEFEKARPKLLGAVLDVVVAGLAKVDSVELERVPRMADFARWGVAIEESLGHKKGTFMSAYLGNLSDGNARALESSPVAWPLHHYLQEQPEKKFEGTAQALLRNLCQYVTEHHGDEGGRPLPLRHPGWPQSASALSAAIARSEPNLAKLGVKVVRGRRASTRFINLTVGEPMTPDDVAAISEKKAVTVKLKQKKKVAGR